MITGRHRISKSPESPYPRSIYQRGSLLIITLWLVTILSVLAVAIGRVLSREVRLVSYRASKQQARALARGGVYLAMERLVKDAQDDDKDWLADPAIPSEWIIEVPSLGSTVPSPQSRLMIRVVDEERKLNFNAAGEAPGDVFAAAVDRLLTPLGGPAELPARLADYIDADETPRQPDGLERDDGLQPPYTAKNAPLLTWSELPAIPGMAALGWAALANLRDWSSVFLGTSRQLNINTASSTVLTALGFDEATALAIESCRANGTVFDATADLQPDVEACVGTAGLTDEERTLLTSSFGISSHVFTIVSEAVIDDRTAVRARIEAVVRRQGCSSGTDPCILAWMES